MHRLNCVPVVCTCRNKISMTWPKLSSHMTVAILLITNKHIVFYKTVKTGTFIPRSTDKSGLLTKET